MASAAVTKKIEETVVNGFEKVSDRFIETFFTREGESVEEAKKRLARQAAREQNKEPSAQQPAAGKDGEESPAQQAAHNGGESGPEEAPEAKA